jgi:hypothetical protein
MIYRVLQRKRKGGGISERKRENAGMPRKLSPPAKRNALFPGGKGRSGGAAVLRNRAPAEGPPPPAEKSDPRGGRGDRGQKRGKVRKRRVAVFRGGKARKTNRGRLSAPRDRGRPTRFFQTASGSSASPSGRRLPSSKASGTSGGVIFPGGASVDQLKNMSRECRDFVSGVPKRRGRFRSDSRMGSGAKPKGAEPVFRFVRNEDESRMSERRWFGTAMTALSEK